MPPWQRMGGPWAFLSSYSWKTYVDHAHISTGTIKHRQTPVSATLSNTIAIIVLVDPSIHVQPAWQRRLPPTLETVSIIFREEEKGTSNTRGYSLAMFSDKPTWRKIGAPKEQREMNTTMAGSYVVQWCSWCGNESGMSSNES